MISCTQMQKSASRSSSSLNGLMTAVTSSIRVSVGTRGPRRGPRSRLASERLADGQDDGRLAAALHLRRAGRRVEGGAGDVVPLLLRVGADDRGAEDPAGPVVVHADLVVGVVEEIAVVF